MSNRQVRSMPRNELVAELGDAVVDANTMAEIEEMGRRSGEPDDYDSLDEILKHPQEEREAFKVEGEKQTAPEGEQIDPAKLPETQEPEKPYTPEEQMKIHQAQTDAKIDTYTRAIELALSKQQQQAPAQPVQPKEAPAYMQVSEAQLQQLMEYDPFQAQFIQEQQRGYKLQQTLDSLLEREAEREVSSIGQKFDNAFQSFKEKYADADSYLPKELMAQARDMAVKSRNQKADFAGWMNMVYWVNAGPSLRANNDEVAKKRETNRQASIKATASVSGGGTQYQPPVVESKDKTIRGGREGFLAELKALGFGS